MKAPYKTTWARKRFVTTNGDPVSGAGLFDRLRKIDSTTSPVSLEAIERELRSVMALVGVSANTLTMSRKTWNTLRRWERERDGIPVRGARGRAVVRKRDDRWEVVR